jgi:AraC family transcriptional regulator of adaptative response / DNA-3-methyladenine glycosylase II
MDADACYRALAAKDRRFDGLFFVGVSTTGVYCRPVCSAKVPRRDRCTFFRRAAEAEREGFRACFVCRPELAPGHGTVDRAGTLATRAAAHIDAGYLDRHGVGDLARDLGISARHLGRIMEQELGVAPLQLALSGRIALAKRLIADTQLPMTQVAFASGFRSLRRFNATFKEHMGRAPGQLRRAGAAAALGPGIRLRLDYRPPLHWASLLGFLRARAIPGVEHVEHDTYARVVTFEHAARCVHGVVTVTHDAKRHAILAVLQVPSAVPLLGFVRDLRALFDLDARPDVVARALGHDPLLRSLLRARPGLRVPGALDGFETGVRAVLGQQVSVRAATTLAHRLVQAFGTPLASDAWRPGLTHAFPSAQRLASVSAARIAAIGLPKKRAQCVHLFARAVCRNEITLAPGVSSPQAQEALAGILGLGPWTRAYIAMRVGRDPDALPAADLVLRKALGVPGARHVIERAAGWQPFRAYGVMHLWTHASLEPSA